MLNNLDKNKKYLLAISGGPDSIYLFYYLYEISKITNLVLCHINYKTRNNSDEAELLIKQISKQKNLKFYCLQAAKINKTKNFQDEARKIRYKYFQEIYQKEKCAGLFVAHQADDVLESYLWQKTFRKNVFFLGIKDVNNFMNMTVYRPLLNIWKKDIISYLEKNNIKYNVDYTNSWDVYERNRIRSKLSKFSLQEKNDLLAKIISENKKHFDTFAKIAKSINLIDQKFFINDFLKLNDQDKLIFLVNVSNNLINIKQVKEITEFLKSIKTRNNLWKYKNFLIEKKYDSASFRFFDMKLKDAEYKDYYFDDINDVLNNDNLPVKFYNFNSSSDSELQNVKFFQNKNTIYVVNLNNLSKNIKINKKIFIKNKIIKKDRLFWPIFVDKNSNNIIFIPYIKNPDILDDKLENFNLWYKKYNNN